MQAERTQPPSNAFETLRRFARRNVSGERCELCGTPVAAEHAHLLEPATRRLACACQACAILFDGGEGRRYKRVPSQVRLLPDFRLDDAQWDSLLVPINLAFFFKNCESGKTIAMYPSPAGATESLLPLDAWEQIVAGNPALQFIRTDVEALLVNRLGPGRGFPLNQYFLLPIDECFKLVGLVRTKWHGLSGGEALWRDLAVFFAALAARAGFGTEAHYA